MTRDSWRVSSRRAAAMMGEHFYWLLCRPTDGMLQPCFELLVLPKMRTHQTFPQLAMVGHREVQQFMDDNVISEVTRHAQQFVVET